MHGFSINLSLPDRHYYGLEAIDLCRKYRLPETAEVSTRDYDRHCFSVSDEAFIRLWFPYRERSQHATVCLDWLTPEQVELVGQVIKIKDDLAEQAVKDLFIRSKFAELQANLEKAERLLAEASAAATEEEDEEEEED